MTTPSHPQRRIGEALRFYFILVYGSALLMLLSFWHFVSIDSISVFLFLAAATAGYAALYTLIPAAATLICLRLLRSESKPETWRRISVYLVAYLSSTLMLLVLYADYRIYSLYEYHFNGFVWNLITTPGGIAALGATDSTLHSAILQVSLFFIGCAATLWLACRNGAQRKSVSRFALMASSGFLLLVLVSAEVVYAYSTYTGYEDTLQAAEAIPFHLKTSLSNEFKRLGIQRTSRSNLRIAGGTVAYPSGDLQAEPLKNYPNIIMLVGESFRWDLLDPEITPNLWQLSDKSLRFERHYSGGNRTRMGLFSMFYGIYAPYWYSFERQRVAPALMEFLKRKDYQLALHTSQSFDYPELRHTLFTGIPEQYLQELKTGEPWQRDRQNISDIIAKLDRRDRQRPFYGFMFFESTHAPYTFPEDAAIRGDYLKDLDYINMNLQENIQQIHARYINAAHHIDREVGRLLDHLKKNDMMENTIILFTGDHGEEFMEKGHWGHGHGTTFPEEQIRVPLVLHLPGHAPKVIRHRTSHLEISPTLLGALGVSQNTLTYSSSTSLLANAPPYFVVGEYDYIGIIDERYKISFPFTGRDFFHYTILDANDRPVPRELKPKIIEEYQTRIDEVVRESRRFVK